MPSSPLLSVLLFASIPAVSIIAGGALAAFRAPGPWVRSAVQHVAAGVVFAALATELLPDVVHRRLPWVTLLGFSLGVVAMLGLKALTSRLEGAAGDPVDTPKGAASLLWISGVDIALDGLLIGISFVASQRQGLLLTLALTLEVFFLGVAAASALSSAAASRARILGTTTVYALVLLASAGAGSFFLRDVSPIALDAVMSFGVAALLYLVTEELLVEAHEVKDTPVLASMFFVGFITLLTIEMLV